MPFLYFPDDKSAYIPAALEFLVILLLCIAVFVMFKKISKKQEMKAKEVEARIFNQSNQVNKQNI